MEPNKPLTIPPKMSSMVRLNARTSCLIASCRSEDVLLTDTSLPMNERGFSDL
ncbi:MAG: hypothetical protein ACFFC7_22885 [Candidatus Hermodarchaeota archaeon]